MTRKYLSVLFFFAGLFTANIQLLAQNQMLVKGVVFERGTSSRIAAAQITNIRTNFSVSSDNFGLFQLNALIGDTLRMSKSGFSDAEVVIKDNKDIIGYLTGSTTLKEVIIKGESKKQELDALKRDFKNRGSFYQGKPPLLSYFFKPLTALYELFGRTPKNARRFGKYYTNELQQTHIDGFFNESSVKNSTNLEGKELEDFMINYRPDYQKAENWTQYDAIKYIRESYKKYTDTLKDNNIK